MSVELICVAPDRVHEFWPHVSYLIHRAIRRTNLSHSQDIDFDVLNGDGLLWIAWNGSAVEAAATTSLIETDTETVCVLTACGGENMRRWLGLLGRIEDYAKAEGCSRVRIFGRKGWMRVLERYRIRNVILEKEL
ncbi:hypothetical protein [Bradyrhizobium sp. SYSU BS000235]|uniref:hypothetical protein n=1 Tax=Bradyrhizobium sp. SYSU BS000235 TaxID=3411332 RepID=UPI003C776D09